MQTKALCNLPAGRESLGGTTIECQHSQLSGVEDEGEVFALIQQGPHHLQPHPSDAGIVGLRNERSRCVQILKRRHEARLIEGSFAGVAGTKSKTEAGLAAKKMRQS